MDTLAETILERDKERGRRRSLALRQGRATQSQPKSVQPLRGGRISGLLLRCSSSECRGEHTFVVAPRIRPNLRPPMYPLFAEGSVLRFDMGYGGDLNPIRYSTFI